MMEQNKAAAPAGPEKRPDPVPEKALPQRRVGSLTLGVCLIAAGGFFLCGFFVPGLNWQLVLKIAPAAGLILLGCEVLFFAARPGRWKYDFVSVLVCLVLMAGCFGLALLPAVWDEISPERWHTADRLGREYTEFVCDAIRQNEPDIALQDVSSDLYLSGSAVKTLEDVQPGADHLELTVELYGPYDSAEAFAADCRAVTDAVQTKSLRPDEIVFAYNPTGALRDALDSGNLKQTEQYRLRLSGTAQQNWTKEQMADQTAVEELPDEENRTEPSAMSEDTEQ